MHTFIPCQDNQGTLHYESGHSPYCKKLCKGMTQLLSSLVVNNMPGRECSFIGALSICYEGNLYKAALFVAIICCFHDRVNLIQTPSMMMECRWNSNQGC